MTATRYVQLELPLDLGDAGRRRSRSPLAPIAERLRSHPGVWYQIAVRGTQRSAIQMVSDIRRGRPSVMVGAEAMVRRGREVWACWPDEGRAWS